MAAKRLALFERMPVPARLARVDGVNFVNFRWSHRAQRRDFGEIATQHEEMATAGRPAAAGRLDRRHGIHSRDGSLPSPRVRACRTAAIAAFRSWSHRVQNDPQSPSPREAAGSVRVGPSGGWSASGCWLGRGAVTGVNPVTSVVSGFARTLAGSPHLFALPPDCSAIAHLRAAGEG